MFNKVLIANRGEIAVRVIRACKDLRIKTVAVYSTADANALHVHLADESVCLGKGPSKESYLNIPAIISAAEITDAEAIHPGYGFLSENSHFAEVCQSCRIKFIGPQPEVMRMMGDKVQAIRLAQRAKVPTNAGSNGPIENEKHAVEVAKKIGYPVIIKASAGGGGRGMRIAHTNISLTQAVQAARTEAEAAFGNPEVYIEKYVEEPRHVEVQLLGDEHGNIVILGERDCSIQRLHQKLIEESPCSILSSKHRKILERYAYKLAKEANYTSAGTIEFLMDKNGNFYFMEMNTRIQVEHPVTEITMDIDLVREQILIASGAKLSLSKRVFNPRGHALECRINAEDPENSFRPSPGLIVNYHAPGGTGIRVDTHIYTGYRVPPYYDSLLMKLIAYGHTRDEAIRRMLRALDETVIDGIRTTIPFLKNILRSESFQKGHYSTRFIEKYFQAQKNHAVSSESK